MLSSVNNYVSNQARNLVLASKTAGGKDFATQFASALKRENSKKLYQACQDLESVLVNTVIKAMRQSIPKSGLTGNSFAEETYQSMLDEEYSKQISKSQTLGVADMLYRQLSRNISDEVSSLASQPVDANQENASSNIGTTTVSTSPEKSSSVKSTAPTYELSDTSAATETEAITPEEILGTDCVTGPPDGKYIDFSKANWQLKWNEMWGKYNQIVTQSTNPSNVGKSITALNFSNDHPVIYAQQYASGRLTNSQGVSIEVGALGSSGSSSNTSSSSNHINSSPSSSTFSTGTNSHYTTSDSSSGSNASDPDYSDGWAS